MPAPPPYVELVARVQLFRFRTQPDDGDVWWGGEDDDGDGKDLDAERVPMLVERRGRRPSMAGEPKDEHDGSGGRELLDRPRPW